MSQEARDKLVEMRSALSTKRKWEWTEENKKLFEEAKVIIADSIKDGIGRIDLDKPLALRTDWSRLGTGFILYQKDCDCTEDYNPNCCEKWRLILAGGKYNNKAESNYAPVEGELLAIAVALHKCRYFIQGANDL